jgi:hypothetical protein
VLLNHFTVPRNFAASRKTDVFLRGYWPNASQADSDGIERGFLSRVVEICLL